MAKNSNADFGSGSDSGSGSGPGFDSDFGSGSEQNSIRLNRFLAERLGISRRQADDAIAAEKVTINGEVARLGDRVRVRTKITDNGREKTTFFGKNATKTPESIDFLDEVCYNGRIGAFLGGKVPTGVDYIYLGMNKPVGYVCSRRRQGEVPTIFELLPQKYQNLKTVGRLDKDSSGLILLTNDGEFAFQMTHPSFVKEKAYEVELDKPLEPLHQQEISDFGIEIGDGVSKLGLEKMEEVKPSKEVGRVMGGENLQADGKILADGSRRFWHVTMSEGRNRQIRRTFAALGYEVVKLHRTKFGKYELSGLKPGEFEEVPKI